MQSLVKFAFLLRSVLFLAAWFLLPIIVVLTLSRLAFSGYAWAHTLESYVREVLLYGACFWLWTTVGLIIALVVHFGLSNTTRDDGVPYFAQVIPAAILVVVSVGAYGITVWENDKDYGRYYANATAYYVTNPSEVPDSLKSLAADAGSSEVCDLLGAHDVYGCVREGALNVEGWEPRVSSLQGATNAIRRKTDGVQRVGLRSETVMYLNATDDAPAVWSGVLNGSGKEQPLYGVAEWAGIGDPKVCRFEGEYSIKRAFDSQRGNNMDNLLKEQFPRLRSKLSDAWGYCDGDEPVVVLPMTKRETIGSFFDGRVVDTAAGVVTIRGKQGEPTLTYEPEVKAGTYRGPVYPDSLVGQQRESLQWTAGRKNKNRLDFGYDPSESGVQAGNGAEYLLRDVATGRNVYVTPLTLRSSSSEVFVAYSVTYADEVKSGELNELSVYVLDRDDDRLVNIDQLAAEANDWMSRNAGTFRSNGGRMIEFTPINGDTWRVFGEMGGQVVYQLDISASNKIAPKLVSLSRTDADDGAVSPEEDAAQDVETPSAGDGSACGPDLGQLDNAALAACLNAVSSELQQRLGQ